MDFPHVSAPAPARREAFIKFLREKFSDIIVPLLSIALIEPFLHRPHAPG